MLYMTLANQCLSKERFSIGKLGVLTKENIKSWDNKF